jgi:hypothetical protein
MANAVLTFVTSRRKFVPQDDRELREKDFM